MGSVPCSVDIAKLDYKYTPFYCEENAWQLCNLIRDRPDCGVTLDDVYVVFISNKNKNASQIGQCADQFKPFELAYLSPISLARFALYKYAGTYLAPTCVKPP